MASLCTRIALQASRRNAVYSCVRYANTFTDPKELATGLEKREIINDEVGKDPDPYGLAIKRGPGTKDKPNLIPSAFDSRIVGCMCEDESTHINWMWLYKGQASRCGCGYWFKLVEKPAL
ncbi:cytochrome c oxidase subunit 5B, mitochondrial-like [Periplaneta americana]|uniref:cytochrome c oxidase subunit 5B, mitochondrial-like n=1 Tax=Periplaneta americana TaxID=6978 RepID=UPI0037E96D40